MSPPPAPEAPAAAPPAPQGLRWISRDYGALRQEARGGTVYDAVIVGSGYGGAMAASAFAGLRDAQGRALRICVLERGKEYAPGMFASSLQELPPHVRVHRRGRAQAMGRADALLDLRVGPHVCTLVGNGLGGTSLINAGVMEKPRWLDGQPVPEALRRDLADEDFLREVKQALHASGTLADDHPRLHGERLPKAQALRKVARNSGLRFRDAEITVQTRPGDPDVPACTLCGDCMTGCNVGAKRSLDTTVLARAHAAGVELYTGGTVLKVEPHADGGWVLHTVYTDRSLRERHQAQPVRARKVVLAAGTLGSTEILMHSAGALSLSRRLGSGFSCNGDNLVAVQGARHPVHTTTDEWEPLARRQVGPTITGVVEIPNGPLLEEFSVPAPLKRLFDETVTTARLLQRLPRWPFRTTSQRRQRLDSMAVDPEAMQRTLLVGVIGHDEAQGRIVLPDGASAEGSAGIEWSEVRNSPMLERGYERAREALERAAPPGADILPNPAWQPLPARMASLVKERGPVLTVHPLGGCPMGASHVDGVVNEFGQVFRVDGDAAAVYDDLVVLDGSILPCSVGANPALTISAISLRAARTLARRWGWQAAGTQAADPQLLARLVREAPLAAAPLQLAPTRWPAARTRPEYRPPEACTPRQPRPTQVELVERLCGAAGAQGEYWVELTLSYGRKSLHDLTGHAARNVQLDPQDSWIRIYDNRDDARRRLLTLSEPDRVAQALFAGRVAGTLTIAEPFAGLAEPWYAALAAGAWFVNRGTRELWDWVAGKQAAGFDLGAFIGSAGRAGERRVFRYALTVQDAAGPQPLLRAGTRIRGSKCLTYGLRSNPWRQLTELRLDGFPIGPAAPVLRLDGRFLAKKGVPLLRITDQENHVVALAEVASFALCWVRMLASIHLWSFRAPDRAPVRPRQLLPGAITGVPSPVVTELPLEDGHSPVPAGVRLTRYPRPGCPPVALIHGYSASGNTFTHEAIPEPLARHLWNGGRDVWVLDLRTSAGMPTALKPWHFEDAAFADLPRAIRHIAAATGQRVSVFAHCIGAVMLSMALLVDPDELHLYDNGPGDAPTPRRYAAELRRLKDDVDRIVLSQKGPMLVYCDDNVLRAYFMRVLRKLVFPDDYQFEVAQQPTLAGGLMDRLLATLPYPPGEFARENPVLPWKRAPWAGFRHRMDALYARDFTLANIEDRTLDAIADLFGPLNLDTVAQAIHFARRNTITDSSGRPFVTSASVLRARWPMRGTVSIHGRENGLVDVKTVDAMRSQMAFAGIPYRAIEIPGYGHQDCLIGRDAARDVFPHIAANL
ncbi:GMC family oxidoreductase N-terminal domain-containing protein [Ramlibacter sp. USB13]|uniref:Cholesterol oxidase n=1 Tax=Ramlibacter cellulosilyticus TaxID=2764187 RepID=A0A923MXM6_9BURK|nr:GMC oxidoreductase [Ramlibacter cellulosilyticus]MBC5786019.1 GMC family oxidoreductase N-terminal domain-containing protein [Ramlibacter cellulosilyticus]